MQRHDVIVIGAGLNGLTAAACLARAGLDVLVLERNSGLGVSAGYDIAPGFRMPRYSLGTASLPARLVADLELTRYGLRLLRVDGGVSLLPDGAYHASYRDGLIHRREMARFSPKDADAWTRYRRDMLAAAARLRPLLSRRMSDPSKRSIANLRRLFGAADSLADIGAADLHESARLWTLSAADYLSGYFESETVKAHLAAAALSGATFGPRAPGSARLLLQPFMDETGSASGGAPATVVALGGPEAVASAFTSAILAHGGKVRTEAEVTDIILRRDEAHGVALANGEEIHAHAILSDLDLKRTFLTLFPWKELPSGFVKRVGRFRLRGVTAKINIALDAAPHFPDVPEGCPALQGVLRLAGSIDEMDRALDDWRERMPPRAPLIEALLPTLIDRTLAPAGKHVMSVCVHGVPESLHDGAWTGERRDELTELVLKRIDERSPGFRERILAVDTLVPSEIETEVGLTSGDFSQGEETLDQMFFNRPFASLSGHETPIRNFYLCSASGHPGSLAPGGAGADAARLVAAALGKRGGHAPA